MMKGNRRGIYHIRGERESSRARILSPFQEIRKGGESKIYEEVPDGVHRSIVLQIGETCPLPQQRLT